MIEEYKYRDSDEIDWSKINLDNFTHELHAYVQAAKELAFKYAEAIGYNDKRGNGYGAQCSFQSTYLDEAVTIEYSGIIVTEYCGRSRYDAYDNGKLHSLEVPYHILAKHLKGEDWVTQSMKAAAQQRAVKAAHDAVETAKAQQTAIALEKEIELKTLNRLKAKYPNGF